LRGLAEALAIMGDFTDLLEGPGDYYGWGKLAGDELPFAMLCDYCGVMYYFYRRLSLQIRIRTDSPEAHQQ